jgi:hypothetical protein
MARRLEAMMLSATIQGGSPMNARRKMAVAALALCGLGLALAGSAGCGTAKAEPLDVTYYYLPG